MAYDEIEIDARAIIDCDVYDSNEYSSICDSRSHFFIKGLDAFTRRGKSLEGPFRDYFAAMPDMRPAKNSIKSALGSKPMTLLSTVKIKRALSHLAQDNTPATELLRQALTDEKGHFAALGAASVVPSIYYLDPSVLRDARERAGLKRIAAAREVLNSRFSTPFHSNLFEALEEGGKKAGSREAIVHYRVTSHLAKAIFKGLQDGFRAIKKHDGDITWDTVFSSDPALGPGRGINTEPLPVSRGNVLETLPHTIEKAA